MKINHLDHVGLRVLDMDRSIEWYQRVLGMKLTVVKEWGPYPVFLLAGRTGIALFPADQKMNLEKSISSYVSIDHFAFNVSIENLETFKAHFDQLNEAYTFKDHICFHSIYLTDPDGHIVELTAITVNPEGFYKETSK